MARIIQTPDLSTVIDDLTRRVQALETGGGVLSGAGVPANSVGLDGQIYVRTDGGAGSTIYQRRSGAWVATNA